MSKYFVRDTPQADLERMMMAVPNFDPRGSALIARYGPDVMKVGGTEK